MADIDQTYHQSIGCNGSSKSDYQGETVDDPWSIFSIHALNVRRMHLCCIIWHARYPLVLHSDKFLYTKKLFMVHIIEACNLKFLRLIESYVCTPFFHSSFKSSINDRRYTSISLPGAYESGINNDIKINSSFMHFQGDILYTTSITDYIL